MLARIQGIVGPFPRWMLVEGEEATKYFTPDGYVYQRMDEGSCETYTRLPTCSSVTTHQVVTCRLVCNPGAPFESQTQTMGYLLVAFRLRFY